MDRNPSPPASSREDEDAEVAGGDCIGSTVYSKHWLFGVLSGLIQVCKLAPLGGAANKAKLNGRDAGTLAVVVLHLPNSPKT